MDSLFNLAYFVYNKSNLSRINLPLDIEERVRFLDTCKIKDVKTALHLRYIVQLNPWIDYDRAFQKGIKFRCVDVVQKLIGFQDYCKIYKNIWKCCKYGNADISQIIVQFLIQRGQSRENVIRHFLVELLVYNNANIVEYLGTLEGVQDKNLYKFLTGNREYRIQKLRETIIYLRGFNFNDPSQEEIFYEHRLIFQYYAVKERELFNDILELGVAPLKRRYQQYIYVMGDPELIRRWYEQYGMNRRNYLWSLLRKDQFTIGQIDHSTHPGYNGNLQLEKEDMMDYLHCIGKKERKDIFEQFYESYFKQLVPDLPDPGTTDLIPTYKEWCLIASERFCSSKINFPWKVSIAYYRYLYATKSPQEVLDFAIKRNDWEIICDLIDMGIRPTNPSNRVLAYINRNK